MLHEMFDGRILGKHTIVRYLELGFCLEVLFRGGGGGGGEDYTAISGLV